MTANAGLGYDLETTPTDETESAEVEWDRLVAGTAEEVLAEDDDPDGEDDSDDFDLDEDEPDSDGDDLDDDDDPGDGGHDPDDAPESEPDPPVDPGRRGDPDGRRRTGPGRSRRSSGRGPRRGTPTAAAGLRRPRAAADAWNGRDAGDGGAATGCGRTDRAWFQDNHGRAGAAPQDGLHRRRGRGAKHLG